MYSKQIHLGHGKKVILGWNKRAAISVNTEKFIIVTATKSK